MPQGTAEATAPVEATPAQPAATSLPTPAATPAATPPPSNSSTVEAPKTSDAPVTTPETPAGEAPASAAVAAPAPIPTTPAQEEPDYKARAFELEEKVRLSELEKDRIVQEAQLRQFDETERQALSQFQADIAPDEVLAMEKYNQAQEALKAGEYEDYRALDREYGVMHNRITKEYQRFNYAVAQNKTQLNNVKKTQFEKAVTNQLKEFDLTPEEVLKLDPKAFENPFAFNKATVKALKAKHDGELKTLKEQIAGAEKTARAKWEAESPAGLTGQNGAGAVGTSKAIDMGPGKTNDLLGLAFAKKR